jgi:hypothetical protein
MVKRHPWVAGVAAEHIKLEIEEQPAINRTRRNADRR